MKKVIIIVVATFLLFLVALVWAIFYSFSTIRPTTTAINKDVKQYLGKVINIPDGLGPNQDFDNVVYSWEMETPQGEVTGVKLSYNNAFVKNDDKITLTLESVEGGDASIFLKVLPAIIVDRQALKSALDPQKANLTANTQIGYQNIKLALKENTNQTTKIVWEFNKQDLPREIREKYQKLSIFPTPVLKFLYTIPHIVISLFSGQ